MEFRIPLIYRFSSISLLGGAPSHLWAHPIRRMATYHFSSGFVFEPGRRNRPDRLFYNPFFRQYKGLCIKSSAANVNYIDFSWILRIRGEKLTPLPNPIQPSACSFAGEEEQVKKKNAFMEKAFSQTIPNMAGLLTCRVMLHTARPVCVTCGCSALIASKHEPTAELVGSWSSSSDTDRSPFASSGSGSIRSTLLSHQSLPVSAHAHALASERV